MHIAVEGMDGVGKSTMAKMLGAEIDFQVVEKPLQYLFDEQGQTTQYEKYRDYINQQRDAHSLRSMFYGFGNLFLYHHFQGVDIITDRHLASNYYWCGNNETDDYFKSLINIIGKPDYTILLHASAEESEKRIRKRSHFDPDLAKVCLHDGANKKIKAFLNDYEMPHIVIDTTTLSPEEVLDQIMKSLPTSLINRINKRG